MNAQMHITHFVFGPYTGFDITNLFKMPNQQPNEVGTVAGEANPHEGENQGLLPPE